MTDHLASTQGERSQQAAGTNSRGNARDNGPSVTPKKTFSWDGVTIEAADMATLEVGKDGTVQLPVVKDGKMAPLWKPEPGVFNSEPVKASTVDGLKVSAAEANNLVLVSAAGKTGNMTSQNILFTKDMKTISTSLIGKGVINTTDLKLVISVDGGTPMTWSQRAPGKPFEKVDWDVKTITDKFPDKPIVARVVLRVGSGSDFIGIGEVGALVTSASSPIRNGSLPLISIVGQTARTYRYRSPIGSLKNEIDDEVRRSISTGGAAVAIIDGDRISYLQGYGFASTDKSEAFTPASITRLASLSKIYTALGVMRLASEGRLDIDKPFMSYVDLKKLPLLNPNKVPEGMKAITVRQLLNMTSGIDSSRRTDRTRFQVSFANEHNLKFPYDSCASASLILGYEPDYSPGSRQAYCNENYVILGRVIEFCSGGTYYDYVNKYVAQPLGITSLSLGSTSGSKRLPNEVSYYDGNQQVGPSVFEKNLQVSRSYGGIINGEAITLETMDSAGGLASSFSDIAKLALALNTEKISTIISPPFIREMNRMPSCVNSDSYFGMGMYFFKEGQNVNFVMAGVLYGCNLKINSRPDGRVVVLAYNTNNSGLNTVENEMPKLHQILNH